MDNSQAASNLVDEEGKTPDGLPAVPYIKCALLNCEYWFGTDEDCKAHYIKWHRHQFIHECNACPQKFILEENLQSHYKAKHLKSRRFKCSYCEDYCAASKQNVRWHEIKHHLKDIMAEEEELC